MINKRIATCLLFVIPFVVIIFFTGCKVLRDNADCKKFHTGKFNLRTEPEGIDYIITRDDTVQVETNTVTGKVVRMSVKWTSDCTYELKLLYSSDIFPDELEEYAKKNALKVKMLKVAGDYYVYSSKMNGVNMTMTDTLRLAP